MVSCTSEITIGMYIKKNTFVGNAPNKKNCLHFFLCDCFFVGLYLVHNEHHHRKITQREQWTINRKRNHEDKVSVEHGRNIENKFQKNTHK
jgi:hypothetical protein